MIGRRVTAIFEAVIPNICLLFMGQMLWISKHAEAQVAVAPKPSLIGAQSCGGGTCHGGVPGTGPKWNSSLFSFTASDPHVHAGRALVTPLGLEIVKRLTPGIDEQTDPNKRKALLRKTLVDRCTTCHATVESGSLSQHYATDSFVSLVTAGVSCESCHGAASLWLTPHTLTSWPRTGAGFRDAKNWLKRTNSCSRCHVGSRTADGMIRDMNHDMIAAGHPPLRFDMMLYMEMLPKHWEPTEKELDTGWAHKASSIVTLRAAAKLSIERRDGLAPQPELSDYDCYACHHSIQTRRIQRKGLPQWNPWYIDGYFSQYAWQFNDPSESNNLKRIEANAATLALGAMSSSGSPWGENLSDDQQSPRDWSDITTWWIRVLPYALESEFSNRLSSERRSELRNQLIQFSKNHLAFGVDSPDSYRLNSPMPGAVLDSANLDDIRAQQRRIVELLRPSENANSTAEAP